MRFRERSTRAADAICEILQVAPNDEHAKAVKNAIEREIIEAVIEESQRCVSVARACCSPDLDMAHKIAREIEQAQTALIANLSSLR